MPLIACSTHHSCGELGYLCAYVCLQYLHAGWLSQCVPGLLRGIYWPVRGWFHGLGAVSYRTAALSVATFCAH